MKYTILDTNKHLLDLNSYCFFGMFEIKLFSFVFVENGILRFFGREKLKLKCLLKKLPGETLCKRAFSLKATLKLIL